MFQRQMQVETWKEWGVLTSTSFSLPPPRSFRFFLVAGIEANIPVTYGIGSQRKNQSTGCQFIGQSPVHSILAAADSLQSQA